MARFVTIAAGQLGPIARSETRTAVVARLMALMRQARACGCDLIVYPELALTTFFPRWYFEDQSDIDSFFEREMPGPETQPLFDLARELGIGFCLGYAELAAEAGIVRRYNTSILVDKSGAIVLKYRKVHLPGHAEHEPWREFQHLEKRYFEPGNGFGVVDAFGGVMGMAICNDRRWPETFRCMGLQGVELVAIGYNTPSVNAQMSDEGLDKRLFHSELSLQAGAYQNATYVVGVAKAGVEDGHPLMGGSIIVDPDGFILAKAMTEEDELIIAECDFAKCDFGKKTIFDFERHRRIEHYGRITSQTGAIVEV